MSRITTKLVTTAAIVGAAIGGGAIANAATSSTTTPAAPSASAQQGQPPQGSMVNGRHALNGKTEQPLSGTTAEKVKAAALAKVAGTVERVETNVDDNVPYEAHITKSDGSQVTVEVNSDFTVANVQAMGQHP